MATIETPKSFILTNQGDRVSTSESLNASSGVYFQLRIPALVNSGDTVRIGLYGANGSINLNGVGDISLIAQKGSGGTQDLNLFISAGQKYQLEDYTTDSLYAIYIDNRYIILYQDGEELYRAFMVDTDTTYQFMCFYETAAETAPLTFSDVLFYQTGLPGLDGASPTTLSSTTPNSILSPSVFRVSDGTVVSSVESIGGDQEGCYLQYRVLTGTDDYVLARADEYIEIGLRGDNGVDPIQNYTIKLVRTSNTTGAPTYYAAYKDGVIIGTQATAAKGDIYSIYADSQYIQFKVNGDVFATSSQPAGFTFKLRATAAVVSDVGQIPRFYQLELFRFYPTGRLDTPSILQGITDNIYPVVSTTTSINNTTYSRILDDVNIDIRANTISPTILKYTVTGYIQLSSRENLYVYPSFKRSLSDETGVSPIIKDTTPYVITVDANNYGSFVISDTVSFSTITLGSNIISPSLYVKSESASTTITDAKMNYSFQQLINN
jgi:hypothetical protein